jgi:hypothetical protein
VGTEEGFLSRVKRALGIPPAAPAKSDLTEETKAAPSPTRRLESEKAKARVFSFPVHPTKPLPPTSVGPKEGLRVYVEETLKELAREDGSRVSREGGITYYEVNINVYQENHHVKNEHKDQSTNVTANNIVGSNIGTRGLAQAKTGDVTIYKSEIDSSSVKQT